MAAYGLQIFGPNGNEIFGSNSRQVNLEVSASISIPAGGSQFYAVSDANNSAKVQMILNGGTARLLTVTKTSSGITLSNSRTYSIAADVIVLRLA